MQITSEACSTENHTPDIADEIFTFSRVVNAVRSFQPYKSAGVDGIFPALLQSGEVVLIPSLMKIFKASLRFNYIPSNWRLVRVIFIPKPGKRDKTNPKSFRPISLSSVLLKTMEKVLKKYVNSTYMQAYSLSKYQYANQSGG